MFRREHTTMCAADIPRNLLEMKLNLITRRDNAAELLGTPSERLTTGAFTKGTGFHGEKGKAQGNIKWSMSAAGQQKLKEQYTDSTKDTPLDARPAFEDYYDSWLIRQRRDLDEADKSIKRYVARLAMCEKELASFEADNKALTALSRHDIELMLEGGNVDNAELPINQHATSEATQLVNTETTQAFLDSVS